MMESARRLRSSSFRIKRSAAINILIVSNHLINTLVDQFGHRNFLLHSHPLQNTRLILCQLYLRGYHSPTLSFPTMIQRIASSVAVAVNHPHHMNQANPSPFYHICREHTRHWQGLMRDMRCARPAHGRPEREMLV